MRKLGNKLIFDTQELFNLRMISSISLDYFVQVKEPGKDFVYSYYMSPYIKSQTSNIDAFPSYAILYFVPVNFIVNTIESIPLNIVYPILDFTMVLRSLGLGGKSVATIRLTIDRTTWNVDGFIGELYNRVKDVFGRDQYNLFTFIISKNSFMKFEL